MKLSSNRHLDMISEVQVSLQKMHTRCACVRVANAPSVDDVRKNILRKEIGRTEAIKRRNKIREKLAAEFEDVTVSFFA